MYIIAAALLLIIAIYFGATIFTVISSLSSSSSSNNKVGIGSMWFVSLLILNLTLITFTCLFYYYTSRSEGIKGSSGKKGFDGQPGDGCTIPLSNGICN